MAANVPNTDHVEDIIKDDQKGRNKGFVDDLLAKEMMRLSVKDRNDIQEEIHGVKCLAVDETPELIRASLRKLTEEIDTNIPDSQKRAYLQSLQPLHPSYPSSPVGSGPSRLLSSPTTQNNNNSNNNNNLSYIHGDDFRLRFLRCDLFDVPRAARRLVTYLDMLLELFGDYALRRPICLSDFSKEELRHMRKGMIQVLPYRDRSGRRIMIAFPEEEVSQIPPFVKAKIAMYMLWAVGCNDIVTQKKGIIVLAWFDASFAKLSTSWKIKYKFYTLNCDRITALHCCSPDSPHYRIRRSVMVMRSGKENINKLIFHLGESMEVHYKLQCYGIPFEHVPISWTGKVKVQYLKQWMRIRQAIEGNEIDSRSSQGLGSEGGSGDDNSSVSSLSQSIIECPLLEDVVFRQGTSGVSHPGNVTFRSLIESTVIKERIKQLEREREQEKQEPGSGSDHSKSNKGSSGSSSTTKKRPKQLALDIYEERLKTGDSTGRFLIWNNDKGWWNEISDRDQICMKIEYMVREFQKLCQKRMPMGGISSSSKKTKGAKTNNTHCRKDFPSDNGTGNYHSPRDTSLTKNVVYLQSETSLFTSQDGGDAPFCVSKRQRLDLMDHDPESGNTRAGISSGAFGKNEMECFGMKFTPYLT